MSESLKIDSSIYMWLVVIVFITPVIITIISEFIFTKRITLKVSGLVVMIMVAVTTVLAYQVQETKVEITNEKLVLSSTFYSSEILLRDIKLVESFEKELPLKYHLVQRSNGINLPSYFAGYFKTHDKSDSFVIATSPPYLVVTSNDSDLLIFSGSDTVKDALLKANK